MNDLFSQLYELFGSNYIEGFSDNLYDGGVYTSTGIATLAIAVLGMIIFYLLKAQKPLTFRLFAWFITVLLLCVINFGIAYALSNSALVGMYTEQNQDLPYAFGRFAGFGLVNLLWSFVFCLITSVVIQLICINTHGNVPFLFRKSHR
jgi:ABC-type transport system involved in multi-copper enzyme maturation permease subunit